MILSSDGTINFDGSIGSWSQSGSHIKSTIYGSQRLRAAGMPVAELDLELSDNNTLQISMYNVVNKQTYKLGARRQGGFSPQANNEISASQTKKPAPTKAAEPQTQSQARPVPQKPGDTRASSSSNSAAGDSNVDETKNKAPKKPAVKKTFRKIPNSPPRGSAPEGLTKTNGGYKCTAINAYARQYAKTVDLLFNERMNAPYRSDSKCQTRCDLLAWREEILATYRYHGSWDCSDAAVGLWNGVDAGGGYSSYHDGKNDDSCTCVNSVDTPILFSEDPK
jgi:hypothetical protein